MILYLTGHAANSRECPNQLGSEVIVQVVLERFDEWVERCGFWTSLTSLLTETPQPKQNDALEVWLWQVVQARNADTNTILRRKKPKQNAASLFLLTKQVIPFFFRADFCAFAGATWGLNLKMEDERKTSAALKEEPYGIHRTPSTPTNLHLPEHFGSCSLSQCEECNQMQIPPAFTVELNRKAGALPLIQYTN